MSKAVGGSTALPVLLSWALAPRLFRSGLSLRVPHRGVAPLVVPHEAPWRLLSMAVWLGQKSQDSKHERQRFPFLRIGDIVQATEDYLRPLLLLLRCPEPRSRAQCPLGVRGLSWAHPVEPSACCRAGSHPPLLPLRFTRGTCTSCQDTCAS